jgi:hypothetical protein
LTPTIPSGPDRRFGEPLHRLYRRLNRQRIRLHWTAHLLLSNREPAARQICDTLRPRRCAAP